MNQINEADIERLMETMGKFAPTMQATLRALEEQRKAEAEAAKAQKQSRDRFVEFNQKLDEANIGLRAFSGSIDSVAGNMVKMLLAPLGKSAFIGIAALGALWSAGSKLNETWRDMTEIGQTFGGSMFQMQKAANAAGMPLETFAKLQKNYNVLINASGKQFWQVNKSLSDNIIKHGMYGMSLDQLGEFTGTYMEVARRNGSLQSRSTGQLVSDMDDLAVMTTALAGSSDKARGEIAKLAATAMSSALAIAGIATLPQELRGSVNKAMTEAITVMASMAGEGGSFAANMLGEAMGASSVFTQGGKTLIEAGMSDLASEVDRVAMDIREGRRDGTTAAIELRNQMIDATNQNIEFLRQQALAGNQAAAQMITMYANQKKLTQQELEQKKKEAKDAEAITALMASIGVIWTKIKAAFGNAFGAAFERNFKGFHDFANSPLIKKLIDFAEQLGGKLGKLLGESLTNAKIDALTTGIENIAIGMMDMFNGILALQPLWTVLGSAFSFLTKGVGLVVGMFSMLGDTGQQVIGKLLGAGIALFAAMKLIGGLKSMFGKLFGNDMVVNARNVIVNGAGGEGGGLGDAAGGKGGGRSRLRRASALARRGLRNGGIRGALQGGLRGMGGIRGIGAGVGRAGLGLAKGLGVGLLGMAGEYGADRLSQNGYGKSATALGVASRALSYGALGAGIGSFIPGVGTVIGGALGAGYGALSGYMDYSSRQAPANAAKASNKAAAATTAAAASIAATNAAMMDGTKADSSSDKPAVDPMQTLIDEIKQLRQSINKGFGVNNAKLDQANRLLGKIEVSAQSL